MNKSVAMLVVFLSLLMLLLVGCGGPAATATPAPTATSVPTATPTIPPTATPTPRATPTSTPTPAPGTPTALPPTATAIPTATPLPTATPTKAAPTATLQPKTLKIGVLCCLSGAGALWGKGLQQGAEIAVEEINAAGGIVVAGQPYLLEPIIEDDKCTAEGGANAARKLVFQDKVKYIIGSICSGAGLAQQEVTEPEKVLSILDTATSLILDPKKPYTFRVSTLLEQNTPLYDYALKSWPNIKKVALINPNYECGWAMRDQSLVDCKRLGLEVVFNEVYALGTTDFYPILTRLLATKPDMLDSGCSRPAEQALLVKQSREMGYTGQIVSCSVVVPEDIVKIAGKEAVEGMLNINADYTSSLLPQPSSKQFYDKVMAKGGPWQMGPNTYWYKGIYALKAGMEKANSLDTTEIMKAMEAPDFRFKTPWGDCWFGGKERYGINRQIIEPVAVSQIRDGKLVTVYYKAPEAPK